MEWSDELERLTNLAYATLGQEMVSAAVARAVRTACAQTILETDCREPADSSDRRSFRLRPGAFEAALLDELRRLFTH
jgi:hypothetical protein